MMRHCILFLMMLMVGGMPAIAQSQPPEAVACYTEATNGKDIDAYMACFTDDALMIDVTREFQGAAAIRAWALREVIGSGESFAVREILEQSQGYAKVEVQWLSWVAHYHYWWNGDGKLTKMSLQYAS